jgi:hypothetical protein
VAVCCKAVLNARVAGNAGEGGFFFVAIRKTTCFSRRTLLRVVGCLLARLVSQSVR